MPKRTFHLVSIILLFIISISSCTSSQLTTQIPVSEEPELSATPSPTSSPEVPSPTPGQPADIIFFNGSLITMEKDQPSAEAIAIRNGVIQAVGSNEEILAYQGAGSQAIDLQGNTLMPGFEDGHTHILAFPDRMGKSLEDAQQVALIHGFTSVTEMWANQDYLNSLFQAEQDGRLEVRVNVFASYNDGILGAGDGGVILKTWFPEHAPILDPSRMVRIPGIKIFVDGDGTPARGCWALTDPFEPNAYGITSGTCGSANGDLYWSQGLLNRVVLQAQNAGFRVAFHAMGDRAIEAALEAIGKALGGEPNEQVRHQIEHNSLINPEDLPRYTDLDIAASVRGYGEFCDLQEFVPAFGSKRAPWYANRYVLPGLGIHAYVETDFGWIIDPNDRYSQRTLDPIMQIYGLVTHKYVNENGSICNPDPIVASHQISPQRALEMLTIEPAYAVSMEDHLGSLVQGKFADLIILSGNPLTIAPDELKELQIWMTMVNGEQKYCADGKSAFCPVSGQAQVQVVSPSAQPAALAQVGMNCDAKQTVAQHFPKGSFVQTYSKWAAKTTEQVSQFISSVQASIEVDGSPISSKVTQGEILHSDQTGYYYVQSDFDAGILPPGEHRIHTTLSFSSQITDGFDSYGPGSSNLTVEGNCTLVIDP